MLFAEVIGVKEELNASLTPTLGFHKSEILGFSLLNQANHASAGVT